jgi:hypothetical protein
LKPNVLKNCSKLGSCVARCSSRPLQAAGDSGGVAVAAVGGIGDFRGGLLGFQIYLNSMQRS